MLFYSFNTLKKQYIRMGNFMKTRLFIMFIILSISSIVFAASDKDKYIANLDPSKDEKIIVEAADWAGDQKEEDAAKKLAALLTDNRDMVRLHAVMALGYIGGDDYIDSINNLILNDKNSSVRYAAVLSTMRIKSDKSIAVWKKAKETETDPFISDLYKKMEEKDKGK